VEDVPDIGNVNGRNSLTHQQDHMVKSSTKKIDEEAN